MSKIRLVRTIVKEYEPTPEYYPEGMSIEEMAQFDAEVCDRELFFEDCVSDEITWEIIEDSSEKE